MWLTDNFSLEEFTHSQTATRLGIGNTAPATVLPALTRTAEGLELVRTLLEDRPVLVSSGYRSPSLNAAIGSKPTSQHTTGQAVDFTCPTFGSPACIVRKLVASDIAFDQYILEFGAWVHISYNSISNRNEILKAIFKKNKTTYRQLTKDQALALT